MFANIEMSEIMTAVDRRERE